jgi:prophage maintenance system killer protein
MLHDEGIAMFWPGIEPVGKFDCISLGLLESAVNQPLQSAFGQDAYPTIEEKAGSLFHSLIANHCFNNGNKRTGVLAIDQFLYANSFVLTMTNEDMYGLARVTASYRESGISSKAMMALIAGFVKHNMVAFSALRASQSRFYAQCVEWRRFIRDHPLNSKDAHTQQSLRNGF